MALRARGKQNSDSHIVAIKLWNEWMNELTWAGARGAISPEAGQSRPV